MRTLNLTLILAIILISFAAGVLCGKYWFRPKSTSSESAVVLLERVREVLKVVQLEAEFSELINQSDYYWFDISPFRKQVIVRVQGKALIGIDLESSHVKVDESSKTISIHYDDQPQILSIEHKLDFYDLKQGTFNTFTPEELTKLDSKARELITQKVNQSDLLQKSKARNDTMIKSLKAMLEPMGWKVVLNPKKIEYKN